MGSRLDLHNLLLTLCPNVYFQPPSNVQMVYPCIVYKRDDEDAAYADNKLYRHKWRYQVTVISRDPESPIVPAVRGLQYCSFRRSFPADNLNHDVFNLFF